MNYKYGCNSEIKQELRRYHITYKDIADKAKYSIYTIKEWMRHILTPEREKVIKDAMKRIREERRLSYED